LIIKALPTWGQALIKVTISDPLVPGKNISWLRMPSTVKAEIFKMRYSPSDKWCKTTGTIALRFPWKTTGISFGDVLELEGAFLEPGTAVFPGGFDYKKHLLSKRIRKIFIVENFKSSPPEMSYLPLWITGQKKVLEIRDYFMNGMAEGMEVKYKRMIAAILFGCRQGLNYESRKGYMQSGVIHIFAISGLHVGMLALSLYLFFCWVPFRLRHLLIPFCLFFYVYSTGMQASAMRAFLMISIWSIHRSSLRSLSPLNTIFLAAVIAIILNPLSILGAGFQYSFTIAGFLVLSWHSSKRWFAFLGERNLWNPDYGSGFKFRLHRFRNSALNSLTCSFIAWLAGSGLNLIHRSFFIPGAVMTNFFILPFVWMLFLIASLEILLFPLRKVLGLGNVLEILLKAINSLSSIGIITGNGLYLPTPPCWLLVIFFAGICLLVTTSRKRIFFAAVIMISGNIILWHYLGNFSGNRNIVTVFHGNESQRPTFICQSPESINVINTGSRKRARAIIDFLTKKGVNSIDTLCFSNTCKDACDGAWLIFSCIKVRHVIIPDDFRHSRYAKSAINAAIKSGAYIDMMMIAENTGFKQYSSADFYCEQEQKNSFSFSFLSHGIMATSSVTEKVPGEKEVQISLNGGRPVILKLLNSNKLSIQEIKNSDSSPNESNK
jgi:competence protein ComEC